MWNKFKSAACAAVIVLAAGTGASADVITDWNEVINDTIRAKGGGPMPMSRYAAMTNVAMFEAVNSISRKYEPYLEFLDAPEVVSKRAAAAAAAHRVLSVQFPDRAAIYDAKLAQDLAAVANVTARDNGVALGVAAADAIIADRTDDGSEDSTPYVRSTGPGYWKPTPPQFAQEPHGANWGGVRPWVLTSGSQFRPVTPLRFRNMPALLRSKRYADEFNEVKSLGRRNSTTRTADQTEIAWFWANDRDGTFKPPGHLLYVTSVLSDQFNLSVDENARLFALVAIGMADAGITAWDCKYETDMDLWRPISGIREADTDNNPLTTKQGNWAPLLEFTPPFPAYISGHSTFGGVHAAIMAAYFGTDNVTFTIGTDEPIVSNVTRTFTSFSQAGRENALSRIYLGVHWRMDCEQGFTAGTAVGRYIFNHALRPIKCDGDFNKDRFLNSDDMFDFADAFFALDPSADLNRDGVVNYIDFEKFSDDYAAGCPTLE